MNNRRCRTAREAPIAPAADDGRALGSTDAPVVACKSPTDHRRCRPRREPHGHGSCARHVNRVRRERQNNSVRRKVTSGAVWSPGNNTIRRTSKSAPIDREQTRGQSRHRYSVNGGGSAVRCASVLPKHSPTTGTFQFGARPKLPAVLTLCVGSMTSCGRQRPWFIFATPATPTAEGKRCTTFVTATVSPKWVLILDDLVVGRSPSRFLTSYAQHKPDTHRTATPATS